MPLKNIFIDALNSEAIATTGSFAIDFGTIYRKKEYDRAIKMRSYKKFYFESPSTGENY